MSPNTYHWISIIGTVTNTVSIWICIKTYMRQSSRIDKLKLEHLKLEFEVLKLRSKNGTGIPSMAEDTKVAE